MKITVDRKELADRFGLVSGVCPTRSPKPILSNVLFRATPEAATLVATDLEVGVRVDVPGVTVFDPGSAVLPTARFGSILRTSPDASLEIEAVDGLTVRGQRSEFNLPGEDPDLFPSIPEVPIDVHPCAIEADTLRTMIRRTVLATDTGSARYALGGCLFERGDETLRLVGTDGRRLALMECPAHAEKGDVNPVVPVKALKLVERAFADDEGEVVITITGNGIWFVGVGVTVYTRALEGRFPRYGDVFPGSFEARVPLDAGAFREAVEQVSIVTSEESRGVDFLFTAGTLRLSGVAADVGSSRVEMPIDYQGKDVEITFDPRYLVDVLKTLDDDAAVHAELIDAKNAAVFKADDGLVYVVMPLTRDR